MESIVVDIGNSRIKIAQFIGNKIAHFKAFDHDMEAGAIAFIKKLKSQRAIFLSVSDKCESTKHLLKESGSVVFTNKHSLPFALRYKTPSTIGSDRLAAALGAYSMDTKSSWLIINLGSCITIDLLHKRQGFLGGNISPGWQMRIKAMHHFTSKLPLVKLPKGKSAGLGKTTTEALQNGATQGIVFEIESYIKYYQAKYKGLKCVLAGGDAAYFENQLKRGIFAEPNLVLKGLNYILANS
jgi:type III pantothenate kinase